MGLSSSLKGLIEAKFKTLQIFSNNKSIIIKELHIHNGDSTSYDESIGRVSIGTVNLSKVENTSLMAGLPKQLEEYGTPILELELSDVVYGYKQAISKTENKTIVEFLRNKIPHEDWLSLNASLYLREIFSKGGAIDRIKSNIRGRYGIRGNNICNLCSAGYFESWIVPLFESFDSLSKETKEKTLRVYNMIVTESPFAVFVSRGMSLEDVKTAIIDKITLNKDYGIRTLTIHGIGNENVVKIETAYRDLTVFLEEYDVSVEKFSNIIAIKMSRKHNSSAKTL